MPKATDCQLPKLDIVRIVHVIPSGEVAALVPPASAINIPFAKVTEFQFCELGKVRAVQVFPSGDVAAVVLGPLATATNTPFPKVTDLH